MDSNSSFEDIEGDYLRLCEERKSNAVSRDTEDHLPIVSQPIPPPVVPAVVPPLVSVSNATSERTDTSSGSSMSYASIKEEPASTSTSNETPMETQTPASSVVVVTIKTGTSVSATTIPADSLSLPPPAAEFSHNKPSVSLPLVSDNLFYVEVKEDQDIPLCLIPSCNHRYTEGYPLMPVGRQGKFLYKQLKLKFPLPVYSHFIFESINDTLFFLIVETDMNIEHLMQHFLNTDFRGNLVPLLRSLGVITGERLIFKTFVLDFDPEYLNFSDNIKMSTFFIQCLLSLSGLRKVTKASNLNKDFPTKYLQCLLNGFNPSCATVYYNINWYGYYPAVPVCDTVPSTAIATLREVVKATVEDISYTNHNPPKHPEHGWTQLMPPLPSHYSISAVSFDNIEIASLAAECELLYGEAYHRHPQEKEKILLLDTLHLQHPLTYKEKCFKWLHSLPLHERPWCNAGVLKVPTGSTIL